MLKAVNNQVHGGQCDESLVAVPGGGKAKFECNGDDNAVEKLVKNLLDPLGGFDKLLKTKTVQRCKAVCAPRYCKWKCHDETSVTMPTYYTVTNLRLRREPRQSIRSRYAGRIALHGPGTPGHVTDIRDTLVAAVS